MTRFFELNPVRKVAANGTIEAIGLEWTEEASWRHGQKPVLLLVGLPMAAIMLFFGVAFMFGMMHSPWLLMLAIAFVVWIIWYLNAKLPVRSALLQRDGKIAVPHGLPRMKTAKFLRVRQPDVVGFEIGPSISGMQHDWTSSVQAVTNTGETVTISKVLHREEAREVVVGLNLALREMRASVGSEPMQRTRNVGPRILVD